MGRCSETLTSQFRAPLTHHPHYEGQWLQDSYYCWQPSRSVPGTLKVQNLHMTHHCVSFPNPTKTATTQDINSWPGAAGLNLQS